MAPPQAAHEKEESQPSMAPPRLQKLAILNKPAGSSLRFATSTWVGIIFHSIFKYQDMKEETSFLWIKAHPNVTVRTLKYMYFSRHPIEEFSLKHIDYYPDEETDQVKHLCQRSPFRESNVIVLRAVEDINKTDVDRSDAEEARLAEKAGKDFYYYHAILDGSSQSPGKCISNQTRHCRASQITEIEPGEVLNAEPESESDLDSSSKLQPEPKSVPESAPKSQLSPRAGSEPELGQELEPPSTGLDFDTTPTDFLPLFKEQQHSCSAQQNHEACSPPDAVTQADGENDGNQPEQELKVDFSAWINADGEDENAMDHLDEFGTKETFEQERQDSKSCQGPEYMVQLQQPETQSQNLQPQNEDADRMIGITNSFQSAQSTEPNGSNFEGESDEMPSYNLKDRNMWTAIKGRMAQLTVDARAASLSTLFLRCEVPHCRKTMILRPWTHFGPMEKPLCTECSLVWIEWKIFTGEMKPEDLSLVESLISRHLVEKMRRAEKGLPINMDDDAPVEYVGPFPTEPGEDSLPEKRLNDPKKTTSYFTWEQANQDTIPALARSLLHDPQNWNQNTEPPSFGPPSRSLMGPRPTYVEVNDGKASESPVFQNSLSPFQNRSMHFGPSTMHTMPAMHVPEQHPYPEGTVDPQKLARFSLPDRPSGPVLDNASKRPAISMDQQRSNSRNNATVVNLSPPRANSKPPARTAGTNFARPGVGPQSYHARPPASRPTTPRRQPKTPTQGREYNEDGFVEDDVRRELAEIGGSQNIIPHSRRRASRAYYPSNLRHAQESDMTDGHYSSQSQSPSRPRAQKGHGNARRRGQNNAHHKVKKACATKPTIKLRLNTSSAKSKRKRHEEYEDDDNFALYAPLDDFEMVDVDDGSDDEWRP